MNAKELIKQIEIKFAKKNCLNTENIVYDNSGYHMECNSIKEAFKEKKWQDITFDMLQDHESSLPFFTDKAFCYFIPIYMIECLRNYEKYDCLLINLIHSLTLPIEMDTQLNFYEIEDQILRKELKSHLINTQNNSNEKIHNFIKRMASFNTDQGRLIAHFLAYIQQHMAEDFLDNEPQIANYRFWFQYKLKS